MRPNQEGQSRRTYVVHRFSISIHGRERVEHIFCIDIPADHQFVVLLTYAGSSSRYAGVSLPGSQLPSFLAKTLLPFDCAAMGVPRKRADALVGLQSTELVRPDICMVTTILTTAGKAETRNGSCAAFRSSRTADSSCSGDCLYCTLFHANLWTGDPKSANCTAFT